MFLVYDRRFGMDKYVFLHTDPRAEGFQGAVTEDVLLEYDMNAIHLWPEGRDCPEPQLGRDPRNPKQYKVFKYPNELDAAKFERIDPAPPFVANSWSDYRKRYYPVPEEYAKTMSQDEWFDFLDEADVAARIRRKNHEPDAPKAGSSREEVAEWVAKQHMGADGGVHEVWFLPSGAPEGEIRLLEVSERFTGEPAKIEPVDFGLDVDAAQYKLVVADVSSDHLTRIKTDPANSLPKDWTLDQARIWGRRR